MTVAIWLGALLAYLGFRLWYDGLGGPLTAAEVERFTELLEKNVQEGLDKQDIAVLRRFMEEDDGKEFIMVNLIQFNSSPVAHPDTGEGVKANSLLLEYFKPLMKIFLVRAGHPVFNARVVGGYVEAWETAPNPGWHVAGLVRYRSRRDAMLASLASSEFHHLHRYKIAAIKQTFAMPTQRNQGLYASPRVTVAMILALGAALLHLAVG